KSIQIQTLRVDESWFGYLDQLKTRLDFLLYLLTHSSLRLSRRQYTMIWNQFTSDALCREEMDLCYLWLLQGSIPTQCLSLQNTTHLKLYEPQDQKFLFDQCISRLQAAHLSETGYLLAASFFCASNKRNGSLVMEGYKQPKWSTTENRSGTSQGLATKYNSLSQAKEFLSAVMPFSPTESARKMLGQYITYLDSNDTPNEDDSNYLVNPDDHYVDPKMLRVTDYKILEGVPYFWEVVLKARLPKVGAQASELLNALHFNFTSNLRPKEQSDIRSEYVRKCLKHLSNALVTKKEQEDAPMVVKRMIRLLRSFLEGFVTIKKESDDTVDVEVKPNKFFRLASYKLTLVMNETLSHLYKTIHRRLQKIHNGILLQDIIIKWNKDVTLLCNQTPISQIDWRKSRVLEVLRFEQTFVRNFTQW
ncbi:hypothetical protein RFI_16705, partial [Reticulomyxa filosa]